MSVLKSLKSYFCWAFALLQYWLGYNLKKVFMSLIIIISIETFLYSLIYYDLSTAISLVTFIFVLLSFFDIPTILEKKQVPKKEIDLNSVCLLNSNELLISVKNITPHFLNYFIVQYCILNGQKAVLDHHFNVMKRLPPDQTYNEYVDVSGLDSNTKYTVYVFVDNHRYEREFEL